MMFVWKLKEWEDLVASGQWWLISGITQTYYGG